MIAGTCCVAATHAQIRLGEGQLTGSFETNTIYYVDDSVIGSEMEDHFGSNNYLKLDYTYKNFSAALQDAALLPARQDHGPR